MSSTSPAWHFTRLVPIFRPKSIKTAKFTTRNTGLLFTLNLDTCSLHKGYCQVACCSSNPVDLAKYKVVCTKMQRFQSSQIVYTLEAFWLEKKNICFETTCQPMRISLKQALWTTFLYLLGGRFKSRKSCQDPCPKHESEVTPTHPQYTIGNFNWYQKKW